MNRKLMLFAAGLLPIVFLSAQHPTSAYEHYRQHAIQMNDLASHIDSRDNANKLVSMVAEEFPDLPPAGPRARSAIALPTPSTQPQPTPVP